MIIGRLVCDKCGQDCTALYGFALMVRGTIRGKQQQEAMAEVQKEFGKNEFIFCWSCTAKTFGAKTLAEKEAEAKAAEVPIEAKEETKKKFFRKDNEANTE